MKNGVLIGKKHQESNEMHRETLMASEMMLLHLNHCYISLTHYIQYTHQNIKTRPNSGGVAEGHPRFDKGGVAIIFYFLRVKNRTF